LLLQPKRKVEFNWHRVLLDLLFSPALLRSRQHQPRIVTVGLEIGDDEVGDLARAGARVGGDFSEQSDAEVPRVTGLYDPIDDLTGQDDVTRLCGTGKRLKSCLPRPRSDARVVIGGEIECGPELTVEPVD